MSARAGEVADALLSISDARAARAKNQGREEGLREAAPDREEARRGGRAAHRPSDREVHRRRGDRDDGSAPVPLDGRAA